MTHHWDPADALAEDLTGVFDLAGFADGTGPSWDEAAQRFVAAGTTAPTVDGPKITVDETAGFAVTTASLWGVDVDGRPYYDTDGAALGEDATFHAAARPFLTT